jgi:Flp pilus assembly protein TadD
MARSDLRRLLGTLDDSFSVEGSIDVPLPNTDQNALTQLALNLRLDLQARRAAIAEAEAALLQAFQLDPRDPDIVYAMAAFYVTRQRWERARLIAEQLAAIAPGDPRSRQLVEAIRQGLAFGPPRN